MIERYFYDNRSDSGVRFARELGRLGVVPQGASGNWTGLWQRELDPVWRERPMSIAGVTPHGAMFMLAQLAQRQGMRLVYQAEVMERADSISMRIQGLQGVVEMSGMPTTAADASPEGFANTFVALNGRTIGRSQRVDYGSGVPARPDEDPYYAWIIAPVIGAARYI